MPMVTSASIAITQNASFQTTVTMGRDTFSAGTGRWTGTSTGGRSVGGGWTGGAGWMRFLPEFGAASVWCDGSQGRSCAPFTPVGDRQIQIASRGLAETVIDARAKKANAATIERTAFIPGNSRKHAALNDSEPYVGLMKASPTPAGATRPCPQETPAWCMSCVRPYASRIRGAHLSAAAHPARHEVAAPGPARRHSAIRHSAADRVPDHVCPAGRRGAGGVACSGSSGHGCFG